MDLDGLRAELDGALVPMDELPDRPPPWHRPQHLDRRRMARDVAMFAWLVVACWAPVVGVVLLLRR